MNDQITKLSDFPNEPPLFRASELVWYVLSAIQVLLVLRFMLKLLGVNSTESFTNIIYGATNYIVYPFTSVLFSPISNSVNIFEWPTLLAIVTYWLLALAIIKLLTLGRPQLSRIEQARMLSIEKYSHSSH